MTVLWGKRIECTFEGVGIEDGRIYCTFVDQRWAYCTFKREGGIDCTFGTGRIRRD